MPVIDHIAQPDSAVIRELLLKCFAGSTEPKEPQQCLQSVLSTHRSVSHDRAVGVMWSMINDGELSMQPDRRLTLSQRLVSWNQARVL
ncbi:hypothetical protein GCM10008960_09130 [Deinococcus sedimenti]|uniref:Uncharacterized protein n=1 Tax=Deinococcus sedimenti TaxID=1867090 RepID=A0ABQ2S187_9DEIO|nr:hypothetical protein GCM10008960_09130 [Deinococcus sedimenti]